jgi:hypothetical protein
MACVVLRMLHLVIAYYLDPLTGIRTPVLPIMGNAMRLPKLRFSTIKCKWKTRIAPTALPTQAHTVILTTGNRGSSKWVRMADPYSSWKLLAPGNPYLDLLYSPL